MSYLLEIFEFGSMSPKRLGRVYGAKKKSNFQEVLNCQNSVSGYRRCKKSLADEYVRKTAHKELSKTVRQVRRRNVLDAQGLGGKTVSHKPRLGGKFHGDGDIPQRIKGLKQTESPNETIERLRKHYYGRGIRKGGQPRYWARR